MEPAFIDKHKIIAICRRIYGEDLAKLAQALCRGGIRMIEVTFDQADPDHLRKSAEAIRLIAEATDGAVIPGAGTVMTLDQLHAAKEAGAAYIISPNTDPAVITETKALGLISIPGAMTPSEIASAHNLGADFVKLFPTGQLGLDYVKEQNLADYLAAGMSGAGISGRLTDSKLIRAGEFAEIERRAAVFMKIAEG